MKTSIAAMMVVAAAGTSLGAYNVSAGASAPTYSTTLNFDEAGGPTGVIAPNAFAGIGLAELQAGDSVPSVDAHQGVWGPWVGTGNSFFGNFGVFMKWDSPLDAFSAQIWDPSGPPGPFGGGAIVFVFNDGMEVTNFGYEPAWGGIGDEWVNVTADAGMEFDEIRILGFGFSPTTFMDNASWNAIPSPGAVGVFGVAGLAAMRRRR